jgi:hypothetical protein
MQKADHQIFIRVNGLGFSFQSNAACVSFDDTKQDGNKELAVQK